MEIIIKNVNAVDKNYNRLVEFLNSENYDWSVKPVLQQTHVSGSSSVQKRYKCLLCGRNKFTSRTSHYCVGGYRKHKIKWAEVE
jgi:hypothetical protein